MKKFVDERKRLANKHEQETMLISKLVKEEEDTLLEENKKVFFLNLNSIACICYFSCLYIYIFNCFLF